MKKYLVIGTFVLLSACLQTEQPTVKTSLEIQAVQSKMFAGSKKDTFNSVMSVLQDLGYIIGSASLETGFITAESPVKRDSSRQANLDMLLSYTHTEIKTAVTASVEEIKPLRTRVRLNFVDRFKSYSPDSHRKTRDQAIHNAEIYQNAFEKIDQELFIRKN